MVCADNPPGGGHRRNEGSPGAAPDQRDRGRVAKAAHGSWSVIGRHGTLKRPLGFGRHRRQPSRVRGVKPRPERVFTARSSSRAQPALWSCGRALRAGPSPAGRVDSPWTTASGCPPPAHTLGPLAHNSTGPTTRPSTKGKREEDADRGENGSQSRMVPGGDPRVTRSESEHCPSTSVDALRARWK